MAISRGKKALLAVLVALALFAGAVVVVPPLLWGDGGDYSGVQSIQGSPEYQDAALLAKAWALPVARLYRDGLDFQSNPSFCGPTSLVNVMRSLGLSSDQGSVLQGSGISTTLGMLPGGLTLDQLAEVARKRLGRKVTVLRDLDPARFRDVLRRANDPSVRLVANFSRGPLFGRGGGHHSPIAGYLQDEDLVFVLDVNQKYRPWLVHPDRLLQAMGTVDRSSGRVRGLLLIE